MGTVLSFLPAGKLSALCEPDKSTSLCSRATRTTYDMRQEALCLLVSYFLNALYLNISSRLSFQCSMYSVFLRLPSLGKLIFLSLQTKGAMSHSRVSQWYSDWLMIWSIWVEFNNIEQMPVYLFIQDCWKRIVLSSYYFQRQAYQRASLIYWRDVRYFFFSSLNFTRMDSTSSVRELYFFYTDISYQSFLRFQDCHYYYFFFCALTFYFSFFSLSSSFFSLSLWTLSWLISFCKFSSCNLSLCFSSCSTFSFSSFDSSSFCRFSSALLTSMYLNCTSLLSLRAGVQDCPGFMGILPSNIIFKFLISQAYCFSSVSLGSSFTIGLFFMNFALLAYRNVLSVYSQLSLAGDTAAIMMVLVFPPRESCSSLVSLESLQGIWLVLPSTSADITLPKALKDRLILAAYFMPSPVACVFDCLQEPAKSTKLSFPALNFYFPTISISQDQMQIVNRLWDLEDYLFIAVSLVALFLNPMSMKCSISAVVLTMLLVRSFTNTPRSGDSFSYFLSLIFLPSKSCISSLQISIKLHRTRCFLSLQLFVTVII